MSTEGARTQFRTHGFGEPTSLRIPGWQALHWTPIYGGPATLLTDGADFVAVAGTLVYDRLLGTAALERLLATCALPAIDWSRIGGEFVAIVRRHGRCFVLGDYFGAYQLFHDLEHQFFSTSLLAAAGAMPRLRFDPQGVYEYAFNIAPIGDDTVFEGLKTLGPGHLIELTEDGVRLHALRKPLPDAVSAMPLEERLSRQRETVLAAVEPFASHFGDHIHCPLSGGLDSRLVLAALRATGSTPQIYVYGGHGDADVVIARRIGAVLGFEVRWIDKSAAGSIEPDRFAEHVDRNFQDMDALPNYGNIFDNGGNQLASESRHAGGALAISGGCGEIFRDFFYLPDRRLSATDIARTFFARVRRGDATGIFDYRDFIARIAGKVAMAIGADDLDQMLPRTVIEQIYPRVRCRALFGREISLESRCGAYAMPFLNHHVVAEAMTLPMKLKSAGRFEAALLNTIDPVLAAQPSAYGHDFTGSPSRKHRFKDWSSRVRPVWFRENSYALQRRLRPMSDGHGGLLSSDYMGRVIDLEFPAMRHFFQIEQITDSALWRRVAALEYLAARLGSRLNG